MFDWRDYLALAEELAARATDEASQRTAISRAYYSVYHHATDICRSRQILPIRGHRIWRDMRDFSRQSGWELLGEVGERGIDLKQFRVLADYHNPFNRDDRSQQLSIITPDAIVQAKQLLALIDELSFNVSTGP